jgi:Ceramidase
LFDLFEHVDQYCERTTSSLLSEPLNFISNLSFFVAGVLLWRQVQGMREADRPAGHKTLIFLIFSISVGSALFHSIAARWAMAADVAPIALFLVAFLFYFLRNVVKVRPLGALTGIFLFLVMSLFVAKLSNKDVSNGSEFYFGTWIALFGIFCYFSNSGVSPSKSSIYKALAAFTLSLGFRTIDEKYCDLVPFGTHFLWHVFNGFTIFFVTKSYLDVIRARQQL